MTYRPLRSTDTIPCPNRPCRNAQIGVEKSNRACVLAFFRPFWRPLTQLSWRIESRCYQAVKFIEQGHIRVGPDTITDPAYLVTRYGTPRPHLTTSPAHARLRRHMEDFVTWVDTSKLKRTIMRYNDEVSGRRRLRSYSCV